MMSSLCLFLFATALAPATDPTTTDTPVVAVEMVATTVNVLVVDRRGNPLPFARVAVNGEPRLQGTTNKAGRLVFTNMRNGSYTLRVERDQYITFEKEFVIFGEKGSVVAAISPLASIAPPPRARATGRAAIVPARTR